MDDRRREQLTKHAVPFLACLLGCSPDEAWIRPMTFQTFTDSTPKPSLDPMAKLFHGSLDDHAEELDRLNKAGAGVFVTVNGTDGRGRKKAHIIQGRAWWADLDTKDAREPLNLEALPLAPSMIVKTPGGWHLYWAGAEAMPCQDPGRQFEHEVEVKGIAAALEAYGGDLKACTVERVLRVPGFFHRKGDPLPVRLYQMTGARYTRDQVCEAFPTMAIQSKPAPAAPRVPGPVNPDRAGTLERAGKYLNGIPASIAGHGGNAEGGAKTFNDALKLIDGFDLSEEEALSLLLDHYNPRCMPPWSVEELRHKVQGAAEKCQNRGHKLRETKSRAPKTDRTKPSAAPAPAAIEAEPVPDPVDQVPAAGPASHGAAGRPPVPGFEWTARGLFYLKAESGRDEDGNPKPPVNVWIAPPFTLPGLVRDEASEGWRLLIAWNDLDGTPHEEGVPFELLSGEGAELARTLAQGGMVLPPDAPSRKTLLRYLCGAMPKVQPRVRLVEALGWQEGAFVLPGGETIGQTGEPVRFAGELPGRARTQRGTLEGWQSGVAMFGMGNPRLAFALACAFAGPLLEMVRPDGGGGFNLMGFSSKGKTTCLEAAASVWGNPHPLPTWRATSSGLESIAATRNDGLLVLDELSQVDPKEAGQVAYMLANGSAKARMSREGGARTMRQWRLVFLSSGEQGLEDKMMEDGKRARAGQEVRVPDIPCPHEGMFENAHGLPSLGALAEHLKAQARKHYGHAIHAFLEYLCEEWPHREALQAQLRGMEAAWLADAVPPGADAQVRRVAGRFALVAVAGELAQRMGILPWPENEASRAASVCFKAWLDRRGYSGASEIHRGIEAVLTFLEKNGQARFDEWGDREARIINRAGTKRRTEGPVDGWDYFLTPGAWKEACTGFSPSSVARACVDAGILDPGKDGNPSQSLKIPGQAKVRVYVVRALGVARSMGDVEAEAMCI